ncbi:MAG TPA: hypothetical protein EYN92_05715 [Dehalococcoidia bacterium]|nr:hypothetical protein [Dehalococcoidia bacterium]
MQADFKSVGGILLHPAYWNASDGHRYWGVAIDLARKGTFTVSSKLDSDPMTRAGPLPALLFALPMKLVGFEASPVWIVGLQCLLLYLAGVLTGNLAAPYQVNATLVQLLIMFNPNLITLAHHAQSDLLFMFLITASLVLSSRILEQRGELEIRKFIYLGIVLGLIPLARPLGFYYILVVPLFLLASHWISSEAGTTNWVRMIKGLFLASLIASIVVIPWGLRNSQVIGKFTLTQSEGIMMKWHYQNLKRNISLGPNHDHFYYLDKHKVDDECVFRVSCKRRATIAYLEAILSVPKLDIAKALVISWAKLFFTPATSQLGRYLGIQVPHYIDDPVVQPPGGYTVAEELLLTKEYWLERINGYYLLLGLGLMFAFGLRFFGVIGLFSSMKNRQTWGPTSFYLLSIGIFMSMYLFSSIGRFRAPLEPILILFAAVGIHAIGELV